MDTRDPRATERAIDTEPEAAARLERALWDAVVARRFDFIAARFADDYVGVYAPGGRLTRADILSAIEKICVQAADLADLRVRPLAPDLRLVTYTLRARGSFGGVPFPPCHLSSALWRRRNDDWQCIYYQETPAEAAP